MKLRLPSLGILLAFGIQANEIEVELDQLKEDLQEELRKNIANYYDDLLTPLRLEETAKRDLAAKTFERFLELSPDNPRNCLILFELAELYFDTDTPRSIEVLQKLIATYPDHEHLDAAYYLLGIAHTYESEPEKAEEAFLYFIDHFKESTYAEEVEFRLAEIYFDLKDFDKAKEYYGHILQDPKARYKYAWTEYLLDNYSEAVKEFSILLDSPESQRDTLKAEAIRYVAISFFEAYPDSISALKEYFAREGHKPWERATWIQLSHLFGKSDKNQPAAQALEFAIQLEPNAPDNWDLNLKVLELTPSTQVKKALIERFINFAPGRATVQRVLMELAIETHADAKQAQDPALFQEAAEDYALFIRHFTDAPELDQALFYYAEASFDAKLCAYAADGFDHLRDWPWETAYREKSALNAVYAYAEIIKQLYPDFALSEVDASQIASLPGPIPTAMQDYLMAVELLAPKFPAAKPLPSFLFQSAGIYLRYGDWLQASRGFEKIIDTYPTQEVARLSASILISKELAKENWVTAAQYAARFRALSPIEFAQIERAANFKQANKLFTEAKTPGEFALAADAYLLILKDKPKKEHLDKIYYNTAMALDHAKRYEEAEHLYEKLYSDFPKSSLAQSAKERRAVYFEERLNFEKAASIYLKIPDVLRAALDLEAAQRYKQAAELFERFIKEQPSAPQVANAYARAAQAYQRAGDKPAELRVLTAFQKRYRGQLPQADYAGLQVSYASYESLKIDGRSSKDQTWQLTTKTKKLARLQKSYESIIKNYPLSSWTLASIYQIGSLYEGLFRALIRAPCPKDVSKIDEEACDEYATMLEDKAFVLEKKAIDAFQLVLDKAPKVPHGAEWVIKAKAALYRMKPGDYSPAEALLSESIIGLNYQYLPHDGSDIEYLILKGSLTEAKKLALAKIDINPYDPVARLQMARIFYLSKRLEAAELTLEDSLEKEPSSALTHLWLGHVYQAKQEPEKALLEYQKALELKPDFAEAMDNLAGLYLEQGDLENALPLLEKVNELLPDFAPVQLQLGNYYVLAKETDQALDAYDKALALDPNLCAVYLNKALLALGNQDYVTAEQQLERFIALTKPPAELKTRVEGYLKLAKQKVQLEKQRHENTTNP